VLADDPQLTCRLPGLEGCSPVRVLLDRRGRSPKTARIFSENGAETWQMEQENLPEVLSTLAERGITRLIVEAGSELSGAFLQENLIDELYWYRAPVLFGTGLPAFVEKERITATITAERQLGADRLVIYRF